MGVGRGLGWGRGVAQGSKDSGKYDGVVAQQSRDILQPPPLIFLLALPADLSVSRRDLCRFPCRQQVVVDSG